jgi:hypothetical protein
MKGKRTQREPNVNELGREFSMLGIVPRLLLATKREKSRQSDLGSISTTVRPQGGGKPGRGADFIAGQAGRGANTALTVVDSTGEQSIMTAHRREPARGSTTSGTRPRE